MAQLRPLRTDDAPAVRHIVERVLASYGLRIDPAMDTDLGDLGASYAHGCFHVLEEDGRIVGCGGLLAPARGRAEIRRMYLLPEARGRGLGKRLLEQLLQDARRFGAETVWLQTSRALREAIGLYRRYDFVERPAAGELSSCCDIYMEKSLGGAEEALTAYERACEHDRAGEEADAIPCYERAVGLGLGGDHRRRALLGLGSSLRNVGRSAEAARVLRRAVDEYPDDACMRCFLALALSSAGRADEAVVVLLALALRHAPVEEYRRALTLCVEDLKTSV